MKKLLTIILISFISLTAQPYQINYSVIIENCDGNQYHEILSGSITEGESFTFPTVNLPGEYSPAQYIYNIFAGGEFGIEEGSLNENIDLVLNLSNFWCNFSVTEFPEGVYRLFSLVAEITGESSGYNPNEYYWFNDNKEAHISIAKDKITFYAALLGISDLNEIEVFYVGENNIDQNDIRRIVSDTHFTIYPRHFSLLSAGIVSGTTDIDFTDNNLPTEFKLLQNYPNPFNPETSINFSIPKTENVKLTIHNILGQKVKTLLNEVKEAGNYTVKFNALDLPSGIYFYKIISGEFTKTIKMTLMK